MRSVKEKEKLVREKAIAALKLKPKDRSHSHHFHIQDFYTAFRGFGRLRRELLFEECWKKLSSSFAFLQLKKGDKFFDLVFGVDWDLYVLIGGRVAMVMEGKVEKECENFCILNDLVNQHTPTAVGLSTGSFEVVSDEVYLLKSPKLIFNKFFNKASPSISIPRIVSFILEEVPSFKKVDPGHVFRLVLQSQFFKLQNKDLIYLKSECIFRLNLYR